MFWEHSKMDFESSPAGCSSPRSSPPVCSEPMDAALKSYFGFSSLKRYQKDVIDKIFEGRDCLVVVATGAGKSICYQLPPIVSKKTAIVVSPLLSLMQDQVMSLNQKGISADYLGSTQTNKAVVTNAQNGIYDVLYLTPERARTLPKKFWTKILEHGVCLFAVDEAHCISEWGTDFRQDYKMLDQVRGKLPGVPCVALTATATDRVRNDIITTLNLSQAYTYIGSFDRPNIFYSVKLLKGSNRASSFLELVSVEVQKRFQALESTIIYCTTIRDTEEVHDAITALGVSCVMYHGQMERSLRESSHKSFVTDKVVVMVATMAFGMGIDKPDVRCVIHYGCPKSLESYYQESGRCGRDGLRCSCYLYYSRTDFCKGDFYCSGIESEKQKTTIMNAYIAAQKYCMLQSCRRRELLSYFGENSPLECGSCDNCTNVDAIKIDLYEEAINLLSSIRDCGCRWGLNMPINVLRGSNAKKVTDHNFHELSIHGTGKSRSAEWWKGLASILISDGFLEYTVSGSVHIVRLTSKGDNLLNKSGEVHTPLIFTLPPEMAEEENKGSALVDSTFISDESEVPCQEANTGEVELYQLMTKIRMYLAKDSNVAPYAICGDQVLRSLSRTRPSNKGTLSLVEGVNLTFVDRFSAIFLHHIKETSEELNLSLDNFDLDDFGEDEVQCPVQSSELKMSVQEIQEKILVIVSSSTGVCIEEIIGSFPPSLKAAVVAGIDELEGCFEIFSKGDMYFTS